MKDPLLFVLLADNNLKTTRLILIMILKSLKLYLYVVLLLMKKFLLGILTILYFGISTGATVHVHYCMGRVAGIGLVGKDKDHCHKCGMTMMNGKKGCCHDEQKSIKIGNDQNSTESAYQMIQLSSVVIEKNYSELPGALITSLKEENSNHQALTRSPQVAVYIRNCVFRI